MKTKQLITRTSVTFAVLTIAGITVAISTQVVPDTFAQIVLVALGSANLRRRAGFLPNAYLCIDRKVNITLTLFPSFFL